MIYELEFLQRYEFWGSVTFFLITIIAYLWRKLETTIKFFYAEIKEEKKATNLIVVNNTAVMNRLNEKIDLLLQK